MEEARKHPLGVVYCAFFESHLPSIKELCVSMDFLCFVARFDRSILGFRETTARQHVAHVVLLHLSIFVKELLPLGIASDECATSSERHCSHPNPFFVAYLSHAFDLSECAMILRIPFFCGKYKYLDLQSIPKCHRFPDLYCYLEGLGLFIYRDTIGSR